MQILDICIEQGQEFQKNAQSNQLSLFDVGEAAGFSLDFPEIKLPNVEDFSQRDILAMEKDILGIYVSGHPLQEYTQILKSKTKHQIADLSQEEDGRRLTIGGVITTLRRTVTKRGETMAYCTLEDLTGSIEVLVFPKTLQKFHSIIETDRIVLMTGRINLQEDNPKFFAEDISLLNLPERKTPKLYIKVDSQQVDSAVLEVIGQILQNYRGEIPVYFYFEKEKKLILTDRNYWISWQPDLENNLLEVCPRENISLVNP